MEQVSAAVRRPGERFTRFFTSGFCRSPRPKPPSVNSKPLLAAIALDAQRAEPLESQFPTSMQPELPTMECPNVPFFLAKSRAQSFKGFDNPGKLDSDALHQDVSCNRPQAHDKPIQIGKCAATLPLRPNKINITISYDLQ